jgi:pilus assembly protein CpaB
MKLSRKLVIVAIILGILTTSGMYLYLRSLEGTKKTVAVWVAKRDIPEKSKIDSSMVKLEKVEEGYVHKLAVTERGSVTGQYAGSKINAGEQILNNKLVELIETGFAYTIPKGKRAMSVAVDKVAGVADNIRVGDFVDVLVFVEKYEVEDKEHKYIWPDIEKMVLQNIQVLDIIGNSQVEVTDKDKEKETDVKEKSLVTLAVSPSEAEKLALSDVGGQIRLTLRSPGDAGIVNTTGAIRDDIVPNRGATVLSK